MSVRNTSDIFSSLLSDTQEHLRQHRSSLSRMEQQSTAICPKPEIRVNVVASSLSSEGSEDEGSAAISLLDLQTGKTSADISSSCVTFSNDLGNPQPLVQEQCCPGFTMPKSSKMRHQGNGCVIS